MFDNRWDHWVSDFADSFQLAQFDPPTRERSGAILDAFGQAARRVDPSFPDEARPGTFATVCRDHLSRLDLPPSVRGEIPELLGQFFDFLQDGGRHGSGYAWGEEVRRLDVPAQAPGRPAPVAGPKVATIRKANQMPVGRNDPCPCGSGKKYKKCCHR